MPEHSSGDAAQIRLIAEQLVKAAVIEVRAEQPKDTVQIGPGLKWLAGIMSILVATFGIWSVKTLNEVQLAVAEVKMQLGASGAIEARFAEVNRRIDKLEIEDGKQERGVRR